MIIVLLVVMCLMNEHGCTDNNKSFISIFCSQLMTAIIMLWQLEMYDGLPCGQARIGCVPSYSADCHMRSKTSDILNPNFYHFSCISHTYYSPVIIQRAMMMVVILLVIELAAYFN